MTRSNPRLSIVWLLVLEMLAVIVSAILFLANILDNKWFLITLFGSIILAAALYSALAALVGRRRRRGAERRHLVERQPAPEAEPPSQETAEEEELMKLGRHLLREQNFGEAIKMFEEVLAKRPHSYEAYNYLGRAYAAQGYYEEAKEAYEKAVGLEYNYASAHFNLATAHEKVGEVPQAVDRWRKYIEVGSAIGERPDWLEHARQRIEQLRREYSDLLADGDEGRGGRRGERDS